MRHDAAPHLVLIAALKVQLIIRDCAQWLYLHSTQQNRFRGVQEIYLHTLQLPKITNLITSLITSL